MQPTLRPTPDGRQLTAQEALTAALTGLLNQGAAPPCRADKATLNRWTSDDEQERQWAAWHCETCTILHACRDAADDTPERWGVWADPQADAMTRPTRGPRADDPLTHDPRCPRRRPPVLVAGWHREPLLNCPDCGRTAPAPDQRPARPARTPEETKPC